MTAAGRDLVAITSNVLSSLGGPTMQNLFWELNVQGVSMNPEEFDIKRFDSELKKIFGEAAEVFMQEIYVQFRKKLLAADRRSSNNSSGGKDLASVKIDENLPAVEKIRQLLTIRVMT